MRPERAHNFGTYFTTTPTWGRRDLFLAERWANLMLAALLDYRSQGKYLLHEFVIMPNHLHLILTPEGITLERAMQFIKGGFSRRATVELQSQMEVWQKGFSDHRIRSFEDFEQHRQYIHMNPVRAKLVFDPKEYKYSSASGAFALDALPQRLKPGVLVG
jgi:putative transposase